MNSSVSLSATSQQQDQYLLNNNDSYLGAHLARSSQRPNYDHQFSQHYNPFQTAHLYNNYNQPEASVSSAIALAEGSRPNIRDQAQQHRRQFVPVTNGPSQPMGSVQHNKQQPYYTSNRILPASYLGYQQQQQDLSPKVDRSQYDQRQLRPAQWIGGRPGKSFMPEQEVGSAGQAVSQLSRPSDSDHDHTDGDNHDANDDSDDGPKQELEEKEGRRSFSEQESDSIERDRFGNPVRVHRKHMINGEPVGENNQPTASGTDFERVVDEIEEDNNNNNSNNNNKDDSSDPNQQQTNQEYDDDPDSNQEEQPVNQQQGSESRVEPIRLTGEKQQYRGNSSFHINNYLSSNDGDDEVDQNSTDDRLPKSAIDTHKHRVRESLEAKQWDDDAESFPKNHNQTREETNQAEQKRRQEEENEAEQGDDGKRSDIKFKDLDLFGGKFPFLEEEEEEADEDIAERRRRRKRKKKRKRRQAEANEILARFDETKIATSGSDINNDRNNKNEADDRSFEEGEITDKFEGRTMRLLADDKASSGMRQPNDRKTSRSGGNSSDSDDNNKGAQSKINKREEGLDGNVSLDPLSPTTTTGISGQNTSRILADYDFFGSGPGTRIEEEHQQQISGPIHSSNGSLSASASNPASSSSSLMAPQPVGDVVEGQADMSIEVLSDPPPTTVMQERPVTTTAIQADVVTGLAPGANQQHQPESSLDSGFQMPSMIQSNGHSSGSGFYLPEQQQQQQLGQINGFDQTEGKQIASGSKAVNKKTKKKFAKKKSKASSSKYKAAKANSIKRQSKLKKGGMKKAKRKKKKKFTNNVKEFKGSTRGKKGAKGSGHKGAKKGSLYYKDKGYKKKGFKKAYQKVESGDHKTYFDEFRDKDHKKKWKNFKDKHHYSNGKKWAGSDRKKYKHYDSNEIRDKKYGQGRWKEKEASKYSKDYKLKDSSIEKKKSGKKKKKKKKQYNK